MINTHYRNQVICRLCPTDGKDLKTDGKEFVVCKLTTNSDGKDKSAKSALPSAFYRPDGKDFAVSQIVDLLSA